MDRLGKAGVRQSVRSKKMKIAGWINLRKSWANAMIATTGHQSRLLSVPVGAAEEDIGK
jgi:hypothetical protein